MSCLKYSREAQSVLPKFHGTQIVLFVEGSKGGVGDDVVFWRNIFSKFCSKKVCVLSQGGKSELLQILNQKGGLGDNVYVALDRDLEDIDPRIGPRRNLIYTYGYSYENDLYSQALIEDIIQQHSHLSQEQMLSIQKGIKTHIDIFKTAIAPYMCAFSKACQKHISLLPKQSDNTNFEAFFTEKKLTLNQTSINKCIARLQEKCCSSGKHKPFDKIRYCNGHLFETFVCRLVNYMCQNKRIIHKDNLRELALRGFEKFLSSEVDSYYQAVLSKI